MAGRGKPMGNIIFKKILVISILTLFVGTSFVPRIGGNTGRISKAQDVLSKENIVTEIDRRIPSFVSGELIIKFKSDVDVTVTISEKGITKTGIASIDQLNEQHNVYAVEKVFKNLKTDEDVHGLSHFYKFTIPKNSDILSVAEAYKKNPNVRYTGPNYIMKACLTPNDPYYSSSGSWGQDFQDLYGLHLINASGAWDISTGDQDVVVAVVDTGIDYNHEDIAENMWINTDEIPDNDADDDSDGFVDNIYGADIFYNDSDPMDYYGHGTHCAGTIGAVGNNSLGVVGVNWQTRIMAVKGLDDSGNGDVTSLAGALVWSADQGAKIISNSWASIDPFPSEPTIEAAVRYAYDKGCVLVFAAGNENDDVQYYCPQNMKETITVAAVDHQDKKPEFSNWGEKVDVCAPGVEILSLRANDTDFYNDEIHIVDDEYYYASGTSMACPHVAGLAALLLSKNHSLTRDMIRTIIVYAVDEINSTYYIGRGRINASNAFQRTPAAIRLDPFANPTDVKGLIHINGTAWGECFHYYVIEYGRGQDPTSWITVINSTIPIQDDILASLDTTLLDEGFYMFRLRLVCNDGVYEESMWMVINNEHNIFIVDDDGGPGVDYTCIQDAVTDAGYGDSIYVCNGTYYEHVVIEKTITVFGEDKDSTIIDGNESYHVVSIRADEVSVSGFTVQNRGSGTGILISFGLNTADHANISGNIITNNGRGISIWNSYNNIISGNDIIGNRASGIHLSRTAHSTISANTIQDNGDRGITLYSLSHDNAISQIP